MTAQQAPKDYTQHFKGSSSATGRPGGKNSMADKLPDETVHLPPIALFALGGAGTIAGILTNIWQMITTFVAFWVLFSPKGRAIDFQKQPVLIIICVMIAFSFQLALAFLVFRLDHAWKRNKVETEYSGRAARAAVVEVVQQTDLILLWSLLGFVVDTVGDYTFISLYTAGTDWATSAFLIFIYAVALYALSTIGFVRSLEYVWAGFSAVARQMAATK
ncbi:MAG TPA: hypothetical protein VIY29_02180 [Ktedonobacteraceae bacterium]